jgi:hypothetical protein
MTEPTSELSSIFRRKLRQQVWPLASDDAAYFVVDIGDPVIGTFRVVQPGPFRS